ASPATPAAESTSFTGLPLPLLVLSARSSPSRPGRCCRLGARSVVGASDSSVRLIDPQARVGSVDGDVPAPPRLAVVRRDPTLTSDRAEVVEAAAPQLGSCERR